MLYKIAQPRNYLKLFAGVVGLVFEQLGESVPTAVRINVEQDDLTKINGIGPAFARRLNEAGIYTYAQLGSMTPDQIVAVTEIKEWQGEPEEWIAQARALAIV